MINQLMNDLAWNREVELTEGGTGLVVVHHRKKEKNERSHTDKAPTEMLKATTFNKVHLICQT